MSARPLRKRLEELLERLPADVAKEVAEVLGDPQVMRAANVEVRRGKIGSILFGILENGLWSSRGARAEDVKLTLKAEGVALERSHVEVQLDAEAAFSFPQLTSRKPRTIRSRALPAHVRSPSLSRLGLSFLTRELGVSFTLASVEIPNGEADVQPIAGVEAGSATFSGLGIRGASSAPLGPTAGVDLGRLLLDKVAVEGSRVAELQISKSNIERPIRLVGVEVKNVKVVDARVGEVDSEALDFDFEIKLPSVKLKSFPELPEIIDRLVTRFWIEVRPTILFHVGNLCLEGVSVSADVGRIVVDELLIPISSSSVVVRELEIEDIEAEGIEIV